MFCRICCPAYRSSASANWPSIQCGSCTSRRRFAWSAYCSCAPSSSAGSGHQGYVPFGSREVPCVLRRGTARPAGGNCYLHRPPKCVTAAIVRCYTLSSHSLTAQAVRRRRPYKVLHRRSGDEGPAEAKSPPAGRAPADNARHPCRYLQGPAHVAHPGIRGAPILRDLLGYIR